MGTISSNLKQKIRTCFENSSPQGNIKAIPNSTNVIFSFFCLKDIFCKELQSQKIYKFSHDNYHVICNDKTEYNSNLRSAEHLGISHLTGKRIECKPSEVSNEFLLHNHDSSFKEFTILCRNNNVFRL